MTNAIEKPKRKPRTKKKPPTQTAGVTGIDGHGAMGDAPIAPFQQYIDWQKLISLPAFEMFVFEESGLCDQAGMTNWIENRRAAMGDQSLYDLYAKWHKNKGHWPNETPVGKLIQEA